MLRSLYIKNYALIEEFTVEFDRGLNIITGETGAGKSIVLGAFSLLIGERASSEVVRHGADKAVVEAEFDITGNPRLKKYLAEKEIEYTNELLIVRREVSFKGTSRGYINDSPASAQILKELGGFLVDLHGQHEHQSLLRAEHHIEMLDDFGGLEPLVEEYQSVRSRILRLDREIQDLLLREAKLREDHDLFEFQLNEILAVGPQDGEDEKIDAELKILENAEELRDTATEIHNELYEEENSAYEKLGNVKEQLERLRKIDSSLEEPLREAQSALAIVAELSKYIGRYAERVELEPEKLATLRDRAQRIQRLKKKYGGTLATVLAKRVELESKLSFEENFNHVVESKRVELETLRVELGELAEQLQIARRNLSRTLEPEIVAVLKELGIEHGSFQVQSTSREVERIDGPIAVRVGKQSLLANSRGIDNIEFFISTNAGESMKPLVRVASGGEISRIMLALKTILAKNDKLPLLVFDEIDVGISGRIAQRVGRAMRNLAGDHQIIAITHLAQIAAFADAHYLVEKTTSNGTTSSRLRRLTDAEHVEEVARLISGDLVSESSLENARVLIHEAHTAATPASGKKKAATA